MDSKILIIMGNGPSLKKIDINLLRNYHTFGLNAAYRIYDKINFYPTYFGCFDYRLNESHKENFSNLILNNNLIKKFFFIGNETGQLLYSNNLKNNIKFTKINLISKPNNLSRQLSKSFLEFNDLGSSGANASQSGILMGYKKIILVGCDCNYVEHLPNSIRANKGITLIKTPEHNPNYWFEGYQQAGDVYNVPQTDTFQMNSWKYLSEICPPDVEIINCSEGSRIPYFKKKLITDILV
tara:strand:+ start:735 stop:1451 length:717 start_codon:yes stop_codon:yes gene_type:complete